MSTSPISTPKGGGAVSGLGEKFSPDLFTGTGNFSVPIALPPGRNGLQPELGLQYSTGSGNGPFGLGWNLSIPGVMRKTAKGVPQYDDEKDTFILSGAEDLIAVKRLGISYTQNGDNSITNNAAGIAPLANENGLITQYRPRTEGLFARIYHLKTNKRNCWKVMSKNGLTSWYGNKDIFESDLSLVNDPDNHKDIFAWKLTRTEDTFGNHIIYTYIKDVVNKNDYHYWDQNYISEIKYTDYSLVPFGGTGSAYMVRVVFNYADRIDAFSDFKSGFEIRTTKRCEEINIYTNPREGEILTRTYHFQYSDEVLPIDEQPHNGVALLCKVEVEGHDPSTNANEYLPPLEFRYTHFKPRQQKFKKIQGEQMPLASLANPGFELIDLFGNGMPDIVQVEGLVRYWRNLGDGNFDIPRVMKEAPIGFSLGNPDVQLIDANGDGRTDLMVNGTNVSGYYSTKYGASWDTKSFKKYKQSPTFSFADPEVKLMDRTGDGITDVLRNGASFECFFQDKDNGWTETRRIPKKQIEDFPNVSFADPRIKLADMSGDGMQDIVLVHSGSIKYWPNKGYGNFGKPIVMKNSPRFEYPFDPARLQVADIDGDGQADLIYIDAQQITFWINQSGNSWSEPIVISGTPFVTNLNGVRVTDILGIGTAGVLYSFDAASSTQQHRWFFLDLTGGVKPYLLHEMDNNMGALTRVGYLPSTRYYLADEYGMDPFDANSKRVFKKRSPWKTTLPFPVQVVSRVEVFDLLSKGKLTTEYRYHHGYWDGGEREFRGFGRVDQRDTETFIRYNSAGLLPITDGTLNTKEPSLNSSFIGRGPWNDLDGFTDGENNQGVAIEHYTPPVETRNWFHLGPVGDEFGDWMEVDFTTEYWQGDIPVLQKDRNTFNLLQTLPRRAKRDALRAWRGSSLRSELYALDAQVDGEYVPGGGGRPYTVSESCYGIRLEHYPAGTSYTNTQGIADVLWVPKETSGFIFFSFATGSRTTQWERGNDPMTQLSFTTDFDTYGQPRKQLSVALSRGMRFTVDADGNIVPPSTTTVPAGEGGGPMLSTASVTTYAQKNTEETYIVDRTCHAIAYEIKHQGSENVFELRDRVFGATLPAEVGNVIYPVLGLSINYYDATTPFGDGLGYGLLGKYGALARTETLVLTQANLDDAFGTGTNPIFFKSGAAPTEAELLAAGYPQGFIDNLQNNDSRLGYLYYSHADNANYATGWYAQSGRTKYDWQVDEATGRGLVLATKDIYNAWASIEYDDYQLLPHTATQYLYPYGGSGDALQTTAVYDYRVMQAKMITDPNGNRAVFNFSPLGLLLQSGVIGKAGANQGDIITESPLTYKPSVLMDYDFFAFKDEGNPVWVKTIQREKHYQDDADSPEIVKVEYTDGFGRLLQARVQAEDVIFGNSMHGDSGLPATQGQNAAAVGVQRAEGDPLNVVVSGFKIYNNKGKVVEQYEPYFDKGFDYTLPQQAGEKVRMYYDPRGNVVRTLNPDASEQWVLYGKPQNLSAIGLNSLGLPTFTGAAVSLPPLGGAGGGLGAGPTPWESYTYDANDLATQVGLPATGHEYTPASGAVDAMGRGIKAISRLGQTNADEVVMRNTYDIQGNVLSVTDALNRTVFIHKYGIAKQLLYKQHLDSGVSTILADAAGKPIEATDAKGARVFSGYDYLSRPCYMWAKDNTAADTTLRQVSIYAETLGITAAANLNLLGQVYQVYDESGLNQIVACDYKGNPLQKFKKVISDDELLSVGNNAYTVDWTGLDTSILDGTEYHTNIEYDALNRGIKITLPQDVETNRAEIEPVFNRAGALQSIKKDGTTFVNNIAYNAKGQQLLATWDNGIMMRFNYDAQNFRLKRVKAEGYTFTPAISGGGEDSGGTYNYNSGTTRYDQVYNYDLVGNILQVNDATPDCGITGSTDSLTRLFEYDALYRLIYANGREMNTQGEGYIFADAPEIGNPTASNCRYYEQLYSYDRVGNMQQMQHRVIGNTSLWYTRNYVYNTANNQHTQVNNGQSTPTVYSTFTYDEVGNVATTNADRVYVWDAANQLKAFKLMSGSTVNTFAHYVYGGGSRVKKLVIGNSGDYESITYIDGVFEYHKKVTTSTTQEKNYLILQGGVETRIGAYTDDDSVDVIYTINDYLSSAAIRLKDDGTIYDKEEYYPYGDSSLKTYGRKRYRYTGKQKDDESGLYYYGARYYASWCCKFMSVDPAAGKTASISSYVYANCNPIMLNDPSGMVPQQGGSSSPKVDNLVKQGTGSASINNADYKTNRDVRASMQNLGTGSAPTGYTWSSGDNPSVIKYNPVSTNIYSANVTDSGGNLLPTGDKPGEVALGIIKPYTSIISELWECTPPRSDEEYIAEMMRASTSPIAAAPFMIKDGIEDVNNGKPGQGLLKVGLGVLPVLGLAEEGPVAKSRMPEEPIMVEKVTVDKITTAEPVSNDIPLTEKVTEKPISPSSKSPSKILGENMEKAGIVRPPNSAAHHIVASTDPRAAVARAILKTAGIDLNDAENGVFLPKSSRFAEPPKITHTKIHSNLYFKTVNERLSSVATADVPSVLNQIRNETLNGTFPH